MPGSACGAFWRRQVVHISNLKCPECGLVIRDRKWNFIRHCQDAHDVLTYEGANGQMIFRPNELWVQYEHVLQRFPGAKERERMAALQRSVLGLSLFEDDGNTARDYFCYAVVDAEQLGEYNAADPKDFWPSLIPAIVHIGTGVGDRDQQAIIRAKSYLLHGRPPKVSKVVFEIMKLLAKGGRVMVLRDGGSHTQKQANAVESLLKAALRPNANVCGGHDISGNFTATEKIAVVNTTLADMVRQTPHEGSMKIGIRDSKVDSNMEPEDGEDEWASEDDLKLFPIGDAPPTAYSGWHITLEEDDETTMWRVWKLADSLMIIKR